MKMGLFDFLKKKETKGTASAHSDDISEKKENLGTTMLSNEQMGSDGIIPFEERIKSAIPSKNGLYPHEILVLDYADSFCTQDNRYQQFWWTRYGVKDVNKVLRDLLSKGFISIASVDVTLRKMTIADLKAILAKYGLSTRGKKEELIQRVIDEISSEKLKELFPNRFYIRTDKGEAELREEEYVPYIHRHSIQNLDIWSLNRLVNDSPDDAYKDVIWQYLNQQSIEFFKAKKYGSFRGCRCSMAEILGEEGRTVEELEMLAEIAFYDLSGAKDNYNPEILHFIALHFFPYEHSSVRIASGIVGRIFRCQEKMGLTDIALKEILVNCMRELFTPIQIFSVDECADIVFYEHAGDMEALKSLYDIAEKKFYRDHPDLKKVSYEN